MAGVSFEVGHRAGTGQGLGRQCAYGGLAMRSLLQWPPSAVTLPSPPTSEDHSRPHTAGGLSTEDSAPAPGGGKWNMSHTHYVWRYAGLYSLTFSSQRGNLAQELADDFKIYLNKCGGQHRLLANCIIGLRPSCFGDFPTYSKSCPGNPSYSALPRSRRVFTWLDLNLAAPMVYSLTCSATCS